MSGPVISVLIISMLSGMICHQVAMMRGAKAPFWALMGLLFGPLAIPFVFFTKRKK